MERPNTTFGRTPRTMTGCGWLYITEAEADGYKELFAQMGKTGGCAACFLSALGRLITFAMNAGVQRTTIIRALKGHHCPHPYMKTTSCPDAIAKVMEAGDSQKEETPAPDATETSP